MLPFWNLLKKIIDFILIYTFLSKTLLPIISFFILMQIYFNYFQWTIHKSMQRKHHKMQFQNDCFRNYRGLQIRYKLYVLQKCIIVKQSFVFSTATDKWVQFSVHTRPQNVRVWIKLSTKCKHNLFQWIELWILETNNLNANNIIKRWINIRRGTFDFLSLFRCCCFQNVTRKLHFSMVLKIHKMFGWGLTVIIAARWRWSGWK